MATVDVAILSCSFRRVFDLLESPVLKQFQSCYGADEDLKDLRKKLRKMQAVLDDADQKQVGKDWVKEWLTDVRDLAYDAEDIVDLYATEVGRWNQVRNSSSHASSSSTNLYKLKKDFEIELRLKEIIEKSEELVKLIDELCLKADVLVERPTTEIVRRERETSSLVNGSQVFGRKNDTNKIVELLLSDVPSRGDEVGVLPIVGMGGLGKTTLAQLVYNDERVVGHFNIKAWVCVSEEVDIARITRYILESITEEACNLESLNSIQVRLKDKLDGKRFLIVLDDIWNENPNDWEVLRKPFRSGKQGSKIIVTTRSVEVSKIMGNISAYSPQVLTNYDSWKLFMQHADVDDKYLSAHLHVAIIEKILKKCKGLPLAVKALGSLLRFKDVDEWKDIVTTDIWDIPKGESFILRILRLSYEHLPLHLKPCFAYCSIFPKDHKFDKEELVWLWMAEGFVPSSGSKRREDIGSGYFDELFSRSFFQYYKDKRCFVMHDLVHDLALSISRETCIAVDVDKLCNISVKARYSSLIYVKRSQVLDFDAFYDANRQSTFLIHFPYMLGQLSFNMEIAHNPFTAWRCLRVLSLRNLPIVKLPDSIGNLRLLRYLDLGGTLISTLPESIYTLYNLQTLILGTFEVVELPKGIHSLINLRHIQLRRIDKMPCGIGRLTNLQYLNRFMVDREDGNARLEELKDLIHLRGELEISGLESVVEVMDVKEANLKNKQHLHELILEWYDRGSDIDSGEQQRVDAEEIIECLQPHKNLKVLQISSYPGKCFPSWIAMLTGLVRIEIIECLQPHKNLKVLQISSYPGKCFPSWIAMLTGLVRIDVFSCEGIQVVPSLGKLHFLERLSFYRLHELVEWSSNVEDGQEEEEGEELFSRLTCLKIEKCPKLTRLPFYRLPSLVELNIYECVELTSLPTLKIPPHVGREGEEFPCLRQLKIRSCHKLRQLPQVLPSLVDLKIEDCQQLGSLSRLPSLHHFELSRCGGKALFKRVGPLPILSRLVMFEIRRLECLAKEFLQSLTSIQELSISNCKNLRAIGSKVVGLHNLTTLQRLKIHGCGKLVFSFPKEEEGLHLSHRFLNKHEILYQLHNLAYLVELEIRMAPRFTSFSDLRLPPMLRRLEIGDCKSFESLPNGLRNLTCLEELEIDNCPGIASFTAVEDTEYVLFPPTLKNIWIEKCKNLESLPTWMQNLASLEVLSIMNCPRLVTFLEGGWPTKLRELEISGCGDYLDSLPKCAGLHKLTSLKKLTISWCSGFRSFPKENEEEWKLPPNLRELSFKHFKRLEYFRPKWLHNLTSLDRLVISHIPKLISLPEEGPPTTLKELQFNHLESLEFLGPKWLHNLTSLQKLHFRYVPKLPSFPEESLPATLQYLTIANCPLLRKSCLKDNVRPKIAYIPNVEISEEGRQGRLLYYSDKEDVVFRQGRILAEENALLCEMQAKRVCICLSPYFESLEETRKPGSAFKAKTKY